MFISFADEIMNLISIDISVSLRVRSVELFSTFTGIRCAKVPGDYLPKTYQNIKGSGDVTSLII